MVYGGLPSPPNAFPADSGHALAWDPHVLMNSTPTVAWSWPSLPLCLGLLWWDRKMRPLMLAPKPWGCTELKPQKKPKDPMLMRTRVPRPVAAEVAGPMKPLEAIL